VVGGEADQPAAFRTQGLDHVPFSVADLERSERFYNEILGLERTHEQWHEPKFMVDHGIGHSIYFDDPDGHELELTTYEV